MNSQYSGGGGSGACGGSGFPSVGGGGLLPAIAYPGPCVHVPRPIDKEKKRSTCGTGATKAGDESNTSECTGDLQRYVLEYRASKLLNRGLGLTFFVSPQLVQG
ncbi:hypothetical protein BDV24DRAFT_167295 [Aspergillus arachidicola]|uniref:Uncharacterized protein n=1 Tax=Aspergillus arachidicola TaxID=656916 RepID=A0A5N6XWB4_9EURO|nr:hypothetical protein BDV24DRAFT_167295 [Aspergillus arachidicola]